MDAVEEECPYVGNVVLDSILCVMMLFADSSARQAENRENYHGAFFLKKVSGAVMSFMLLRPCLKKDSRAASSSNLLEM